MSSEDANDYMHEMAQTNAANANEFRITTVSMEKVLSSHRSITFNLQSGITTYFISVIGVFSDTVAQTKPQVGSL